MVTPAPRLALLLALLAGACGNDAAIPDGGGGNNGSDGGGSDAPPVTTPGIGGHALAHYGAGASSAASITTPAFTTQPSGSTIVVSIGRGQIGLFDGAAALPTDTKGNTPYVQQDDVHNYTHYMSSGTALYAFTGAAGGAGFKVTTTTGGSDEVTLGAVEIVGRTQVHAVAWNEVVQPDSGPAIPVTSHSVTTTAPATLVAFWWGDAPEPNNKTAVPDNGFAVIDSILLAGALVQCAVAVKDAPQPGTYDVTWAATPRQGAQLWLIAVQ
jgi:hypothetical protein